MLLVHDPEEEEDPDVQYSNDFKFASGLTPATRNIRKRKFRKRNPEITVSSSYKGTAVNLNRKSKLLTQNKN